MVMMKLPRKALTDVDLKKHASNIPKFRGVFMRNALPLKPWLQRECGIVNLDDESGPGTHWVAYKKTRNKVLYYDPFGDLRPPQELVRYFRGCEIFYNYNQDQDYNTIVCGHLCLKFLYKRSELVQK